MNHAHVVPMIAFLPFRVSRTVGLLILALASCISPAESRAESPSQGDEKHVLLIGSSSMRGVIGMAIVDAFERWPNVRVTKIAESATGLARPDYFDWVKKAQELAKSEKPDLVVCNLGPNDGQSLREGKDWHYWGTDSWRELYMKRVAAVLDAFPDATFIWLGPPAMLKENTSLRQALISVYIRTVVRSYSNARFIDLFALTSNTRGEYINTIVGPSGKRVKARSGDGIHFKFPAARRFAERVIGEALPALGLELQ